MKKILFCATVESHILFFHIPYIEYFQKKGYEVHIAARLGNRQNELKEKGIICHDICFERSIFSVGNIRALKQLIRLMRDNEFSLVHTHTPIASFLGRYAAKVTNTKPVLYTAHGFHFYKGAPLKNWIIYYTAERIAAHWTDGLITINEEDYIRAKKFNLRSEKSVFLVNGVGIDLDKYKLLREEERNEIRGKLGYTDDDFVILTVAELIKRKNYTQIIDSIEKLSDDRVKYISVGTGILTDYLNDYVIKKKLEDSVKFLGYRSDITELLNACDVFVITSLHEGLPKCIMEAMACSKPVIATDVRGNRDLVKDGVNGFLVPVDDIDETQKAILKLFNSKVMINEMGSNGLNIIKKYELKSVLEEMKKIYKIYI